MFKKQTTVFISKKREPELMARINKLGENVGLKPSIALRQLLNNALPQVDKKKDGKVA